MKIFIVGNSRSGTTMLARIFGRNADVNTFNELHFFEGQVSIHDFTSNVELEKKALKSMLLRLVTSSRESIFSSVSSESYLVDVNNIAGMSKSSSLPVVYENFLYYECKRNSKRIPCEQTPGYLYFSSEILRAYSDAWVVNIIRDPRSVLLSQKFKWKRKYLGAEGIPFYESLRSWVNYNPYLISKLWVSAARKAFSMEDESRFITLKFEDLVSNPSNVISGVCEKIGIEFDEDMLRVPQVGSSSGRDFEDKVGVNAERVSAWDKGGLSSSEIYICERVAAKEMLECGYHKSQIDINKLRVVVVFLLGALKMLMVLPMNIHRTKNILDTVGRRLFPRLNQ